MTIIKKKHIKTFSTINESKSKKELDELVDADGSPIEGDRNAIGDVEIEVPQGQTTDDFATSGIQPRRPHNTYGGTSSAWTSRVTEGNDDIDNNNTPDMEDVSQRFNKPIPAGKTKELIDSINKNNLSGEELGMILNHLMVNIDLTKIPQPYKEKIKSLL